MKRIALILILSIFMVMLNTSCQDSIDIVEEDTCEFIISENVPSTLLEGSSKFLNKIKGFKEVELLDPVLISSEVDDTEIVSYTVKDENETRRLSVVFNANDEPVNVSLTDVTRLSSVDCEINYYALDTHELLLKVYINSETEESKILYKKKDNSKGLGQDTMDCISDMYTNHGWLSVTLWVGTLVDPGIGIAVAAGCLGAAALA